MEVDILKVLASLSINVTFALLGIFFALIFSSYIKILTVLGILKAGLGFNNIPAAIVTSGLALTLTIFVMAPQAERSVAAIENQLKQPLDKNLTEVQHQAQAINAGIENWKAFVKLHSHPAKVKAFSDLARKADAAHSRTTTENQTDSAASLEQSWRVLAPAFVVSELEEAFKTGLTIFLPFLVIDLLSAIAIAAVGLERLSPALVSFPLKLLAFITLDGWATITTNLVSTYLK